MSDVKLIINDRIIHIETKAGLHFFDYINATNNFGRQLHNMLAKATSISDVKVPLHPIVKAGLNDETIFATSKQKVINLMQNWENGKILNDNTILTRIHEYGISKSYDFVNGSILDFLNTNDDWFIEIFKDTNL